MTFPNCCYTYYVEVPYNNALHFYCVCSVGGEEEERRKLHNPLIYVLNERRAINGTLFRICNKDYCPTMTNFNFLKAVWQLNSMAPDRNGQQKNKGTLPRSSAAE